ncbi:DUF6478 family protein [Pseudaestuariivita atlantica]|uniref:Uncharacterized protein n=1 Tax=Pseudaestuariivita atlantica TaxID=1317121 RepID=A0A0L1JTE2_9RHOB|nr:DUF6478 family protein [Pseudaestuariivita atlantica]KNG94688.1 hypothetical protein ATO11_04650 [Pseudaestuariivita atlantica]
MSDRGGSRLDRMVHGFALRRWARAAESAAETDLSDLRDQRGRARALRSHIDKLLHVAEGRLALPAIGSTAIAKPHGTDWAWRPELWRGPLGVPGMSSVQSKAMLGREVTLFHDCAHSELTLRQLRNTREADLAPFGLRLDVFQFDGSYLSLAIDLPKDATEGLRKRHVIRMETIVEMEKPLELFARLNIKHGPNTEQIVREVPVSAEEVAVEFDLAYTKMNEKRVTGLWLDVIFEGPQMNQVILRDLTMTRFPRAEM